MRNFYILYKITYYDDFAERTENAAGVVYAENFSAAIEKLEKYYGEIKSVLLLEILAEDVMEFDSCSCETMKTIKDNIVGNVFE